MRAKREGSKENTGENETNMLRRRRRRREEEAIPREKIVAFA